MKYDILLFFFQAEDGIRDIGVTGVQTCALPIYPLVCTKRSVAPPAAVSASPWSAAIAVATSPTARSGTQISTASAPRVASAGESKADRESVVEGKRVDLGGRRII